MVTITIDHVTGVSVKVLVVDKLNSPAILGHDIFHAAYDNMVVDWKAQTLQLDEHVIPLEGRRLGTPRQSTELRLNPL